MIINLKAKRYDVERAISRKIRNLRETKGVDTEEALDISIRIGFYMKLFAEIASNELGLESYVDLLELDSKQLNEFNSKMHSKVTKTPARNVDLDIVNFDTTLRIFLSKQPTIADIFIAYKRDRELKAAILDLAQYNLIDDEGIPMGFELALLLSKLMPECDPSIAVTYANYGVGEEDKLPRFLRVYEEVATSKMDDMIPADEVIARVENVDWLPRYIDVKSKHRYDCVKLSDFIEKCSEKDRDFIRGKGSQIRIG